MHIIQKKKTLIDLMHNLRYLATCSIFVDIEDLQYNMGTHVLLNLSNRLRKRDKMGGLPTFSLFFRNKFNQQKIIQ